MCNVKLRRVRVTTVTVEKEEKFSIILSWCLCFCHNYPATKPTFPVPYYIVVRGLSAANQFFYIIS